MTTITAKSLLASRHFYNPNVRGDTMELRFPRIILAEENTHRVFSRNTASSRAIPFEKIVKDIIDDPFIPLHWGKNQKGMQAYDINNNEISIWTPVRDNWSTASDLYDFQLQKYTNEKAWLLARDKAIEFAMAFNAAGYHKQICNRLLEPWMHVTVVLTASKFKNFFALRDHPAAEPHMQILAKEMKQAYDNAEVIEMMPELEWHLPYITQNDFETYSEEIPGHYDYHSLLKISAARCASTSYKTVDGKQMTREKAFEIFDSLTAEAPIHASPTEHQFKFRMEPDYDMRTSKGGNFGAWFIQYRKTLENETVEDTI